MKNCILRNGINILFHQMLNTHSVTIGLYIKAGSYYENLEHNGITHFLEHLHFRRMGSISQEELYYRMECMGSSLRGLTYSDFLEFSMKVIPNKMFESLSIFKDIIYANEWTEEEFQKEKQVVINQIKEKGDYVSIDDLAKRVIFSKSPMSNPIMGTAENVECLKKEELLEYKKQIFNKKNLVFCITGCLKDEDWEKIKEELEAIDLPDGIANQIFPAKSFHQRKPDVVYLMTEDLLLDVNLSFDISYDRKTEELISVLNCILGEGTGSNLQKRIREELGYTSDIYSYLDWYDGFAVLNIRFSVEKKMLVLCLTEIVRIIKLLKSSITKKDLDVSIPFYTTNRVFLEDDTAEMNFQLAYQKFILKKDFGNFKLQNNVETIIQLQELANGIFVPQNTCVAIIGNTRGIAKKAICEILALL